MTSGHCHTRRMEKGDLDLALHLVEGWGNNRDDLERLLEYEPEGCFIAEAGGEALGMVSTTSYGSLAWIGSFIVEPRARGKGIGT
jgi:ribosomal protein S18 acetylase RimI-like enzyme